MGGHSACLRSAAAADRLYEIHEVDGVHELEPFPWNHAVKWRHYANTMAFAHSVFKAMEEHGSILIYCKRGANRSAAAALLCLAWATGRWNQKLDVSWAPQ